MLINIKPGTAAVAGERTARQCCVPAEPLAELHWLVFLIVWSCHE